MQFSLQTHQDYTSFDANDAAGNFKSSVNYLLHCLYVNVLFILHWTSWSSGEVFLVSCCRTFKWNWITSSSQQHAAKRPYHNNFPLATFTRNCPKLVPDCTEHQNIMCPLQQFPHLTNQMVHWKNTFLDATHPFLGYCACPTYDPSDTQVHNNSTITRPFLRGRHQQDPYKHYNFQYITNSQYFE